MGDKGEEEEGGEGDATLVSDLLITGGSHASSTGKITKYNITSMDDMNEQHDHEVEDKIEENRQLLADINKLCNGRHGGDVENILLLGTVGAGKSSVVNTIIKAISGMYIPKAKVGQGSIQSKTFCLERYLSCGVTEEFMGETESTYLSLDSLVGLPTIFDVAGQSNTDNEELEEILELLIGGHVQPGTNIEALSIFQEANQVGSLKDTILTESKKEWRITKIVFVHSCRETVPDKLIECLLRILRKTDPGTAMPKYSADVYVVLTKYDLVRDENSLNLSNEPSVTSEEFQDIEKEIEDRFSIRGSLEDNRTKWMSYTDASGKDNPNIDNIALKFIKRMLMVKNNEVKTAEKVFTTGKRIELKMKKCWRNAKLSLKGVDLKEKKVTLETCLICLFLCSGCIALCYIRKKFF